MYAGLSIPAIESAIRDAILAVVNTADDPVSVVWSNGEVRQDLPSVDLMWSQALGTAGGGHGEAAKTRVPNGYVVTLANPTPGKAFRITTNGTSVTVTASGSLVGLRDAVIAAISADEYREPVAAVDRPADGELLLTPTVPGGLRSCSGQPVADVSVAVTGGTTLVRDYTDQMRGRMRVICRTRPRVSPTAHEIGIGVLQAMRIHAATLSRAGVSVGTLARPIDLSGVYGSELEQRVELDLTVAATARTSDDNGGNGLETIATVEVEGTADGVAVNTSAN